MSTIGATRPRAGKPLNIGRMITGIAIAGAAVVGIFFGVRGSDSSNAGVVESLPPVSPAPIANRAPDVPVTAVFYIVASQEQADQIRQAEATRESNHQEDHGYGLNRNVEISIVRTSEETIEARRLADLAALELGSMGVNFEFFDLSGR